MEFGTPAAFILALLALPAGLLLFRRRRGRGAALPTAMVLLAARPTLRLRLARALPAARLLALLLLVAGLARPRVGDANAIVRAQGIDIALALDISSSMTTSNLGKDDRLTATKRIIKDFINGRENDRIGLVVFQEDALPLAPPTLDYVALDRVVADVESGILPDGTGIGVGIATALNMLRDSTAASRIVILLTDGAHNTDSITPEEAADLASALRVKVYTIGVVGQGRGQGFGNIDEDRLRGIADATGGRYFVADDPESLASIYDEIGDLEKSALDGRHFERHEQRAPWFLAGAGALIAVDLLLRATWLRRTA